MFRPATTTLTLLSPEEELRYMREQLGLVKPTEILDRIAHNLMVLQTRAGMLLSLITICLTISGFSGHRIAGSGPLPGLLMSSGLTLAVVAALLLMMGPLQLRWITRQACPEGFESTVIHLLTLRNLRTRRYHKAAVVLLGALGCYISSVVLFVLRTGVAG